MISVQSVSKRYGPVVAVDGLSFDVDRGEVVGFLGPNGAGKTTTMRMLTGTLEPDEIGLSFEGRPREGASPFEFGVDSRNVSLDEEYAFELRALSASAKYVIHGAAAGLVDYLEPMREAALGELAAMIAHEVRNLMTPVVAGAQRALREPSDAERARTALEAAARGGLQAVGVADAILDLAVEAGVPAGGVTAGVGEAIDLAAMDAVRLEVVERDCKYYNRDIHRAALALPNYLRQVLGRR